MISKVTYDKYSHNPRSLIDIKDSDMLICDEGENKFTIRNKKDFSIIKRIVHKYGYLRCGLSYPEQK